ncbi:hypothetical protein LXL04_001042 [Taraxacum kok-saghyz]
MSISELLKSLERERKRKHDSSSRHNNDNGTEVGGRVLRSRNPPTHGGTGAVHSGPTWNITEPLNQNSLEPEVEPRPRRDVGHPSSLHGFHVQPVLKLTREFKPKPRNIPPVRTGVCMMFATGYSHEPRKRRTVERTNERSMEKKAVRDRIISMLTKANWEITRVSRNQSSYERPLYIDRKGRKHWSITNAYLALKKSIDEGEAHIDEISAFTEIPEAEFSKLFKVVTKVRSNKNINKETREAEKVFGDRLGRDSSIVNAQLSNVTLTDSVALDKRSSNVNVQLPNLKQVFNFRLGKNSLYLNVQLPQVNQNRGDNITPLIPDTIGVSPPVCGKRNLLTWMIHSKVIQEGWKLQYGRSTQMNQVFEGIITANGVLCTCCNETMGISKFTYHAGGLIGEFHKVYLETGMSFLDCLKVCWRLEESKIVRFNTIASTDDNFIDDTCDKCGYTGFLVGCDSCPAKIHPNCNQAQKHGGQWRCEYCLCKFCLHTNRWALDSEELLSCALCEDKFHEPCGKENGGKGDCPNMYFCGTTCHETYRRLQSVLGNNRGLGDGFSFSILKRYDFRPDLETDAATIAMNSKLAVAVSIINETFLSSIDERTGVDLIRNVFYNCGSNYKRLDHGGFFTAIIEKDDEVVSVASIRVHGNKIAEMPFIGTRMIYREQGMCKLLLDSLVHILRCLGIEELVIPAIPDSVETWINIFGFKPLEESTIQKLQSTTMVDFPGTQMLQKDIPRSDSLYRINRGSVAGIFPSFVKYKA